MCTCKGHTSRPQTDVCSASNFRLFLARLKANTASLLGVPVKDVLVYSTKGSLSWWLTQFTLNGGVFHPGRDILGMLGDLSTTRWPSLWHNRSIQWIWTPWLPASYVCPPSIFTTSSSHHCLCCRNRPLSLAGCSRSFILELSFPFLVRKNHFLISQLINIHHHDGHAARRSTFPNNVVSLGWLLCPQIGSTTGH